MTILDYPLPGPNFQHWYTISVPQDTGVYDIPVYAPRLTFTQVNLVSEPLNPELAVPEPGLFWVLVLVLLLMRKP